jgi:hypothetical protein
MKRALLMLSLILAAGACRSKPAGQAEPPPPEQTAEPPSRSCEDILFDLEQSVVSGSTGCEKDEDCGCFDEEYDKGKCGVVTSKAALVAVEKFAAEARAADCELPRPCPDFECKPHCRPRPGFDGFCTPLTRCIELSEEFDRVLAEGSRKCEKDEDCGTYRAGVGMNCGGVTGIETAKKLAGIADEFFRKKCRYTVNCAPRPSFHGECRSGVCLEVSDAL